MDKLLDFSKELLLIYFSLLMVFLYKKKFLSEINIELQSNDIPRICF